MLTRAKKLGGVLEGAQDVLVALAMLAYLVANMGWGVTISADAIAKAALVGSLFRGYRERGKRKVPAQPMDNPEGGGVLE